MLNDSNIISTGTLFVNTHASLIEVQKMRMIIGAPALPQVVKPLIRRYRDIHDAGNATLAETTVRGSRKFQPSSAMRIFCAAVSSLKGGDDGPDSGIGNLRLFCRDKWLGSISLSLQRCSGELAFAVCSIAIGRTMSVCIGIGKQMDDNDAANNHPHAEQCSEVWKLPVDDGPRKRNQYDANA
jgi:hypothetical protein